MKTLLLDGNSLTVDDVRRLSTPGMKIGLSPAAQKRMRASRALVEEWVERGDTIYGVTTGFGELATVRIGRDNLEQLQLNLIRSHSAGAGEPLTLNVVRAMMVLRLNALAKGFSGIRVETAEFLAKMYNKGIIPVIPSRGSVGSSGDLAPLSHLVLGMIGEGSVVFGGRVMQAARAMKLAGLKPVRLSAKEGLALVNGTQMMAAIGCIAAATATDLCKIADITGAITTEALKGSDTAFDDRIHALRPHPGQRASAANLRKLMTRSEIRESHRYGDARVQDAYSIRCMPQVHGATRDALRYALDVLAIEINSATDNPLIFPDDIAHLEGGNFHGQPVAFALDFLAIGLAELANISERRIERLVNGNLSNLPKFLTENGGLNSGMMIAQYTAASLVSENKVLAHPASVDSIPTSANQEDHVSMGAAAARHGRTVLAHVEQILAIELLCAAQALDLRLAAIGGEEAAGAGDGPRPGTGVAEAHSRFRQRVAPLAGDREPGPDLAAALALVHSGALVDLAVPGPA